MSEQSTTAKLSKSTLKRLRERGVHGQTVDSIINTLIEQVKSPDITATIELTNLRAFVTNIIKEYVTNIEGRLAELESIYKTVITPRHEFQKRERERRVTHGQTKKCVCRLRC